MINRQSFRLRESRKDKKRRERLLTKLQKAQAIKRREEVERLSTWNRRFGRVCRLRSQRQKENQ
jgi:hypothetical protein